MPGTRAGVSPDNNSLAAPSDPEMASGLRRATPSAQATVVGEKAMRLTDAGKLEIKSCAIPSVRPLSCAVTGHCAVLLVPSWGLSS
jgi:hypothetical protein